MTTTTTVTLVEFLLARIAEDEQWAIRASKEEDGWLVQSGVHWRWGVGENWATAELDPAGAEYLTEPEGAALLSVEERPVDYASYTLPQVALRTDEVRTVVAGHIARHDPARVLAECVAKRRVVDLASDNTLMSEISDPVLRLLTFAYADHPDYLDEWRP